jgi:hypothetical protein
MDEKREVIERFNRYVKEYYGSPPKPPILGNNWRDRDKKRELYNAHCGYHIPYFVINKARKYCDIECDMIDCGVLRDEKNKEIGRIFEEFVEKVREEGKWDTIFGRGSVFFGGGPIYLHFSRVRLQEGIKLAEKIAEIVFNPYNYSAFKTGFFGWIEL